MKTPPDDKTRIIQFIIMEQQLYGFFWGGGRKPGEGEYKAEKEDL